MCFSQITKKNCSFFSHFLVASYSSSKKATLLCDSITSNDTNTIFSLKYCNGYFLKPVLLILLILNTVP